MSGGAYFPHVILCIDDEPVGLQVRRLILESAGYRVITTSSGKEGVRLSNEGIDLVIVDYWLPGQKGTEIARDIKQARPYLPVVLLSGETELPEASEHVDRFMTKVKRPAAFLAEIAAILKEARKSAA